MENEVTDKINKIILGDVIYELTEETDLIEDLNYDSLKFVEMIIKLESEFDFEFEDEMLDLDIIRKYKELMDAISNLI